MSGLRETAERIAGMGGLPAPRRDRVSAIERAAARLASQSSGTLREVEPWDDFLRRIGVLG